MGAIPNEPSMEDILSSIKRIISDGGERPAAPRGSRARAVELPETEAEQPDTYGFDDFSGDESGQRDEAEPILELTQPLPDDVPTPSVAQPRETIVTDSDEPRAAGYGHDAGSILSDRSAQAARESLSHLSAMLVRPEQGESPTLEALVRDMLRPMLKDWLEAQLPDLVESLVKKEIDRIVGRLG